MKGLAYLLAIPLALGPIAQPVVAQQGEVQAAAASSSVLSRAELEQLLAPIALYPDDLLVQVLAASTYPLEIVLAARWVEQPAHKALKGDALVKALEAQDWDPSVKSLVPFPAVLKTMSDRLDWTQNLGDAFLAQEADVLAAVQALRGRASGAGTLKSTPQQTVSQEGSAIVIQPAQPDTVYVPAYDPNVAYGTWPYPAYPPTYYPPPAAYYPGYYAGGALAAGLAFGAGVAITGALWGWGNANWGGGNVNVNVNRFNQINANRQNALASRSQTSGRWQHNAAHRRGVAYPNSQLRQQFRGNQAANAGRRDAFRGRNGGAGPGAGLPALRPGGGPTRPAGLPQTPRLEGSRGASGAGGANLQQRAQGASGRNTADFQNKLKAAQRPATGRSGGAGPQRSAQPGLSRPSGGGRANFQGGMQRSPQRSGFQQRSSPGGSAFRGMGNAGGTRAASAQGRASRAGAARGGGGGGGGFRRGGGGRR